MFSDKNVKILQKVFKRVPCEIFFCLSIDFHIKFYIFRPDKTANWLQFRKYDQTIAKKTGLSASPFPIFC